MTKPTLRMLEAISQTSLLDDVMREDPVTNELQSYMAKRTGHESALLVMSGTMGNQLAIRTHLGQPPHSVLCDHRSHIIHYEAGGMAMLSGTMPCPAIPQNGVHLTLDDIRKHAVLDDDIHHAPTKLISLENTLDGLVMPLSDARRITEWAKAQGIKVHLDGARLWEAVVSGVGSLAEYAGLFDSVSLCFSKGLGAPIGSILVGPEQFIKKARHFRKAIGGGVRQTGVIAAAARAAVEDSFGPDPNGKASKLQASHSRARKVADMWTSRGGKLSYPVHSNMVWLDLKGAVLDENAIEEIGKRKGLKLSGGRIVVHYRKLRLRLKFTCGGCVN